MPSHAKRKSVHSRGKKHGGSHSRRGSVKSRSHRSPVRPVKHRRGGHKCTSPACRHPSPGGKSMMLRRQSRQSRKSRKSRKSPGARASQSPKSRRNARVRPIPKGRKSPKSRRNASPSSKKRKSPKSRKSRKTKSVHAMHDFQITSPIMSPSSMVNSDGMSGVSVQDIDAEGATPEHPSTAAPAPVASAK